MKKFIFVLTTILSTSLFYNNVCSQNPTYYCDIRNESFSAPNIFEFDLYISRTGTEPLELACFNAGIKLNSSFINGGSITVEILEGSDLVTSQVPTSITFNAASSCIQLAPQKPPRDYSTGITSGTIIETNGSKICGIRLSNSVDFGADPATFTWSHALDPYRTVVSAFVDDGASIVNALITDSESNSRSAMATVFLEGLFFDSQNRKAMDEFGEHFFGPVADKVNIGLADATSPHDIVYNCGSVNLSTNGKVSFQVPASLTGSYYLVVNHRNSLETWSSAPVLFNTPSVIYDFTTDMASAFGDNMIEVLPGTWAIFAGDVNQDGAIDSGDYLDVDNGSFDYLSGYLAADVNGDGIIDSGDYLSIDNNGFNYIGLIRPY